MRLVFEHQEGVRVKRGVITSNCLRRKSDSGRGTLDPGGAVRAAPENCVKNCADSLRC